jgi:hypothetical protein
VGAGLLPWLLVDLTVLRGSASQGNAFASVSDAQTLFLLRATAAWNLGPFSAGVVAGAGALLSQTHYSLEDPGQPPEGRDANGFKPALQAGFALRSRPLSGLEVRAEVSFVLRDGRFEPLLAAGLGWSL